MRKITSNIIKASLLHYFRFIRNEICSTEYSYRKMDIASITENKLLKEVEIKINLSDLRADKKKRKHYIYKKISIDYWKTIIYPNYFYFCVPTQLLNEAKNEINKINTSYGLIEYIEDRHNRKRRLDKRIRIIKRAKLLHSRKAYLYHMALRNCSELCQFYKKEYEQLEEK